MTCEYIQSAALGLTVQTVIKFTVCIAPDSLMAGFYLVILGRTILWSTMSSTWPLSKYPCLSKECSSKVNLPVFHLWSTALTVRFVWPSAEYALVRKLCSLLRKRKNIIFWRSMLLSMKSLKAKYPFKRDPGVLIDNGKEAKACQIDQERCHARTTHTPRT